MKQTIYEALKEKLKREPTSVELKNEVRRIIEEATIEIKLKRKKEK